MLHIDRHLDGVAPLDFRTGVDFRHEVMRIVYDRLDLVRIFVLFFLFQFAVKERFGTEHFHDVDVHFDAGVRIFFDKARFDVHIFRTHAERDFLTGIEIIFEIVDKIHLFFAELNFFQTEFHVNLVLRAREFGIEEVHLRRADEARDELVDGVIVKGLRRVHLLHEAVLHDDDTRTHGHRFDLIVRNVNERGGKSVMDLGDFRSHLCAEFRVEVGKRFVEKEYFRFADDRTAERDTLSLTAGKRLRLSAQVHFDTEDSRGFLHPFVDFRFGNFSQFQTERHVVVNGHVRIKRVVLEHHRDIPVFRRNVVFQFAVDIQFAVGNFFKTRDHTERCRFTATGRADEYDEFFILNFKVEVRNGGYAGRINLVYVLQR